MDGNDPIWDRALSLLGRRSLSIAELREALLAEGRPEHGITAVVQRLLHAGYLDDERLALEIVLRDTRRGHAPSRVDAELARRSVPVAAAAQAWEAARRDHGVDTGRILRDQLRRRIGRSPLPLDRRAGQRIYNAMLRAGFPAEQVRGAIEPYLHGEEDDVEPGFRASAGASRSPSRWSRNETSNDDDGP